METFPRAPTIPQARAPRPTLYAPRSTLHPPASLDLAQLDRRAVAGGLDGGVEDALGFVGVGEIGQRHDRLLPADALDDVGRHVDEAVLVPEDVGVRPPRPGVGMAVVAAGDVDGRPALQPA